MTVAEVMEQARALSLQERKELVKLLVDSLDTPEAKQPRRRRLTELRGLGKEIWEGIDAQEYVDQLRNEWDTPVNISDALIGVQRLYIETAPLMDELQLDPPTA